MASLAPGTLLGGGRYRVLREINRGGTAVVYECQCMPAGSPHVALKVMGVKDGRSAPIKGVKREIQYTASVQHENVVQLIDFFAEDKKVVIVWELISGPDLLDLLNECGGRLSERDAACYFQQLLRGVTFIHERGLCHRDLKPENVMLDRASGRIKIIDFGLSKHAESAVTLGVGTPDYMAPELLGNGSINTLYERHTGVYDAQAADIWALGVMLFLLVTGLYPFEDPNNPQNVVATLQNISQSRIRPLPAHVSPACANLIASMLIRDPKRRITLPGIAAHPWVASGGTIKSLGAAYASAAVAAPAPPTRIHAPVAAATATAAAVAPAAAPCAAAHGVPRPDPAVPATPLPAPALGAPATPAHPWNHPAAQATRKMTEKRASSSDDADGFSLTTRMPDEPTRIASFAFDAPGVTGRPTPNIHTQSAALEPPTFPALSRQAERTSSKPMHTEEPAARAWEEHGVEDETSTRFANLCRLWFGSAGSVDFCGR